jgi:DNA-binding response OmpR family regulator
MAKILLVDDDKLMVKMYQGKFEDDGFSVAVAVDGQKGFDRALEFKPDLILLDIMMPKVNGLEMLKKLKSNDATKKTPVILLTNVGGSDEDVKRGLGLGAVAYMVKAHYDAKDVVAKVKEILGGYVRELPKVKVAIEDKPEKKGKNLKKAQKAKKELEAAQKKVEEASKKLKQATTP